MKSASHFEEILLETYIYFLLLIHIESYVAENKSNRTTTTTTKIVCHSCSSSGYSYISYVILYTYIFMSFLSFARLLHVDAWFRDYII